MEATLSRSAAACPDARYTRLPDALLPLLTPREHQLVHALLSYRWYASSTIYPRVTKLAERLGCSVRTIQRTLRRLEARGFVVTVARYRDDRAGQTSNEYRAGPMLEPLLPPADGAPVTTARDDRRPPVTPVGGERYSGNRTSRTRRPERGYVYPPRDGSSLMLSRYGPVRRM